MIYVNNDTEYVIFPNIMDLEVGRIRATVTNNVTNQTAIGIGSNSSENPLYLKINIQAEWLNQFPNNEYTVKLECYDKELEEWIFIGNYLVQKGIESVKNSSVFEDDVNYIQFD